MIFTFILPCKQNSNNKKNYLYQFFKDWQTQATIYFNNDLLEAKNHFSRLFKYIFSNSRLLKALKTVFFNSRLFKGFQGLCEPWVSCTWLSEILSYKKDKKLKSLKCLQCKCWQRPYFYTLMSCQLWFTISSVQNYLHIYIWQLNLINLLLLLFTYDK